MFTAVASRRNVVRFPSTCGEALPGRRIGVSRMSSSDVIWYCGVCTATGYWMPLERSSQKLGATWLLELSETSASLATSRWVSPCSLASARSTSSRTSGSLTTWAMWTSTAPRTPLIVDRRCSASA